MVEVFYGSNSYALKQAKDKLRKDFIAQYGDFGLESYEAKKLEPQQLIEIIATPAFLSPQKLVLINDLSQAKDLVEQLLENIDQVPETNHVLIIENNLDKRSRFAKQLKTNKSLSARAFEELNESELAKWTMEMAEELGSSISRSTASYLVERVGTDQMQLYQELRKLCHFADTIDREAIDELTEETLEGNVFKLTDALAQGDYALSLKIYQQLRRAKLDAVYVFTMISWQLQNIAMVKSMSGSTSADLSISPFVVRKTQPISNRLSSRDIKHALKLTLDTDIKLKTKSINPDHIVQNLLMKLATIF